MRRRDRISILGDTKERESSGLREEDLILDNGAEREREREEDSSNNWIYECVRYLLYIPRSRDLHDVIRITLKLTRLNEIANSHRYNNSCREPEVFPLPAFR